MNNENLLIKEMITKAKVAQKIFETFTQEQVDSIVKEIGKTVFDNAEKLARLAVDETEMGVYEDKVTKNQGKSRAIWNNLKDKKSVGIIGREADTGLVLIAKPIGVVGAVTPTTNPIVTPMCNSMFALKGRNAIIIAPHPRAKKSSSKTVELCKQAIKKLGAPDNLIQIIEEPSIEATNELMKNVDVVVATGGMAMVKAAYSSGKPSFGVGAGNVQVILDREIDFDDTSKKIILGRKFDNGIICSGEQSVIIHKDDYKKAIKAFEDNGAFYVEDQKIVELFRKVLFVDGHMNKDVVGQSVEKISKMAGVDVPPDTKVVILKSDGSNEDLLRKEKMCPFLVAFEYENFDEAIKIVKFNISLEGRGHTCAIHSNIKENIEKLALSVNVSRIVVNQPSSISAGGSFYNGFAPTTTLGCGTWGNNSISENFDYKHLINIQRIGNPIENNRIPTSEELWA